MDQPEDTINHWGQQGQASVFVLALLGVVLLITVFLYQSGRITSEKMQLQNGADAAAFGASTLEARSLNFAAYTNRAMVANEVAIGQLVGMLSWADELTTSEEYAETYTAAIETAAAFALLIPFVGEFVEAAANTLVGIIETIGSVLTSVGEALESIFDVVIPPAIRGISLVNEAYSASQEIYHGATYALIVKNIYQCLEDNVYGTQFNRSDLFKKNLAGARLSDLGVIALVGHLPSYWSGYTKIYSPVTAKDKKDGDKDKENASEDAAKTTQNNNSKDDKKKKKEKEKDNNAGMGRFAATVRQARDPFSSGGEPKEANRNWNLELDLNLKVVEFVLGGESVGGSELRKKNDSFVWSAADSLIFEAKLRIIKWWIPLELPFGSGGFQATGKETDKLSPADILPSSPGDSYGSRSPDVYGGAGDSSHLTAWPGVVVEMEENSVRGEPYKGLQPYRDMTDLKAKDDAVPAIPFTAPFFLVGVTKPLTDLSNSGPQFAGHFDLTSFDSATNVDRIGAIAKSQLYFARPTDLSYFLRHDKKQEKANVFSPFWQARLVDTSNADRFLALAMQQRIIWLTEDEKKLIGGSALDSILTVIDQILDAVTGVLDGILKLFL